jgi:hypothetical protein
MKIFLTYTAIFEGLTGFGLIFIPTTVVRILCSTALNGSIATLLAIVAGAAIFSIALVSWLARSIVTPSIEVKMLLFYNASLTLILFYGALKLGFGGIVLWTVIVLHFMQTIISVLMLQKK